MAKRKQNLNGLYISPRLRDSLAPIGRCALTTVVAPMGYGKTTAINWYLAEQAKGDAAVQTIRVSIYSDNLSVFWKSVQKPLPLPVYPFWNSTLVPTTPPAPVCWWTTSVSP